jgi:hypothetical protein
MRHHEGMSVSGLSGIFRQGPDISVNYRSLVARAPKMLSSTPIQSHLGTVGLKTSLNRGEYEMMPRSCDAPC